MRLVFEHQYVLGSEWVDCFEHRCLLVPICNVPPAEYEKMYYDGFNTRYQSIMVAAVCLNGITV